MLGYTFNTISLIYPRRDVYISSLIQPEQIDYIQNSIAKMNLSRTYDKTENHIRVEYKNDIIANTKMSATLYSIGSFIVENTIISFNPNIYENVLGCVILHEMGHAVGLGHNNITGSIMNFTLYINEYGYILNDNTECYLNWDDINGINYLFRFVKI